MSSNRLLLLPFLFSSLLIVGPSESFSQTSIRFDIDSIIECDELEAPKSKQPLTGMRLIQIPLFVSADINDVARRDLKEIRVEFQFLQRQNTVFDYSPQTTTYSRIQGTIQHEKHHEKNASLGFNVSGSYDPLKGNANAGIGSKQRSITRYSELPTKKLVSATGTVNRRSGVYFKFLEYSEVPWDSEREISIIAQVPQYWRAGIARITIIASAEKTHLPGIKENFIAKKQTFHVPLVQQGDRFAFQTARDLNQTAAKLHRIRSSRSSHHFDFSKSKTKPNVDSWFVRPPTDASTLQGLSRNERVTVGEFAKLRRQMFRYNSDKDFFENSPATELADSPRLTSYKPATNQSSKKPLSTFRDKNDTDEHGSELVWRKAKIK